MANPGQTFATALEAHFPGSILEADFISNTAELLDGEGFTRSNTLAGVAVCRDEIAATLSSDVEKLWGPPFSLASLAGMVTAGKAGFSAALSHAPTDNGRRHLVAYAMPHIAIDRHGTIGQVRRPGVSQPSSACGALVAYRHRLQAGHVQIGVDRFDAEMSLLSHRLQPMLPHGEVPDLVELTKLAAVAIEDDLTSIIDEVLATSDDDDSVPSGATFTGIQIHGPEGTNYVWPRNAHIVVDGTLRDTGLHR
jgi:hypothetical protein